MPDHNYIWPWRRIDSKDDFFPDLRKINRKKGEIHEDMTPEEIADIVTEHLMDNIRKQFAEAKERYLKELENKKT